MTRCVNALVLVIAVTAWGVAGTGCQSTSGKTAKQTVNDASITAAVQSKLTADRLSNFTRVDVDTERGVVYLSGVVPSSEQRTRAEESAKQVTGMARVTNNLQVQSQAPTTGRLHE